MMQPPPGLVTLQEGRDWLSTHKHDGAICPCCSGNVRVYRWSIYHAPALWLTMLVHRFRASNDWVHVKDIINEGAIRFPGVNLSGGDNAKLRHWGLTKEKWNEDGTKRCSGFWMPTTEGIEFADNRVRVRKIAIVFMKVLQGFDGEYVSISECLQEGFDYSELMSNRKDAGKPDQVDWTDI